MACSRNGQRLWDKLGRLCLCRKIRPDRALSLVIAERYGEKNGESHKELVALEKQDVGLRRIRCLLRSSKEYGKLMLMFTVQRVKFTCPVFLRLSWKRPVMK